MDKEMKETFFEIVLLVLLLFFVVPICVQASNRYREMSEKYLQASKMFIDIHNRGDIKEVVVSSYYDDPIPVRLVLKINKFSDDYSISLDGVEYSMKNLEYREDEMYRYYYLGDYVIDQSRKFDFQFHHLSNSYDDSVTYSFITEGVLV